MDRARSESPADRGLDERQVMHAMSIDDAYHIECVLGKGAGGRTELVTIDGSGPFVRKRIDAADAHRAVWAVLADCQCPYLPMVRATYEMPDEFVVVYDYVPGEALSRFVADRGRLSADDACRLAANICDAAAALHARGVIHRDISPANVIVSADGAHLIDLGIARMSSDPKGDGEPMGTWGYAAPEQYGFAKTDARSDVYSIGRLFAFMLTGLQSDDKAFDEALPSGIAIPAWLQTVIGRACAFEPSARYQSAAELKQAIGHNPAAEHNLATEHEPAIESCPEAPAAGMDNTSVQMDTAARPRRRALAAFLVVAALVIACIACVAWGAGTFGTWGGWRAGDQSQAATESHPLSSQGSEGASGAGGQSQGANGPSGSLAAPVQLSLDETCWSIDSQGYVSYGFKLISNESDRRIDFPAVSIVGRAEDGSVVFADDQVLNAIFPGQTIYWGGIAGNGTAPSSVEFEVVDPDSSNIVPTESAAPSLDATGLTATPGSFGDMTIAGEVSWANPANRDALDEYIGGASGTAITVVLYDAAGKMVHAETSFADLPDEGDALPFSIDMMSAPAFDAFEVSVQPW